MATRQTKMTLHGVPVDMTVGRMRVFFTQYGQVEEVSAIISKEVITTGDFVLQVTMTRRNFDVPRERDAAGCVRPRRRAPGRT